MPRYDKEKRDVPDEKHSRAGKYMVRILQRHAQGLCRSFKRFARYDTTKSQVRAIILKMEDCIDAENTDSRRRRSHRESN